MQTYEIGKTAIVSLSVATSQIELISNERKKEIRASIDSERMRETKTKRSQTEVVAAP